LGHSSIDAAAGGVRRRPVNSSILVDTRARGGCAINVLEHLTPKPD
jgi:hypothetical protein